MVAKAVQLMKGTIVCEAALGQGAQFYVKLNFNPDLPKADISEGVKRES
jgi:signal transduction histidine kinase